ncbi:hypothetical protein ACFH04_09140 [Streptomyces noboritoensis]|uniref:Tat pathway signal sequence domain protein n=1 Tax=Streptomyces noboritoensis TaxID=67337 RepID=A0ABV6TDM1_9ACTN
MQQQQPGGWYGPPQAPTPGFGPAHDPVPVPPQRRNKGRMALLAPGVTCAVAAAAVGGYLYGRRTSDTTGTDATRSTPSTSVRYQLTAPQSVLGGAFVVDPANTTPASATAVRDYADLGVASPMPVSISYKSSSSASRQTVQLTGAWGTLNAPEQVIDRRFAAIARSAAQDPGGYNGLIGPRQTMHPTGLGDAVMKCQNFRVKLQQTPTTSPVCIWADHYTLGEVMVFDPAALLHGGAGVSLGENADTAARIRNDARKPR